MSEKKTTVGFRITDDNRQRLLFLKRYYETLNGEIKSKVSNSDVVNLAIQELVMSVNESTDSKKVRARKQASIDLEDYKSMSN